MQRSLPGTLICFIITLLSFGFSYLPFPPFTMPSGAHPFDSVMIAILLGLLVNLFWKLPPSYSPGIHKTSHVLLPLAIILLGARFDLRQVMALPLSALLLILGCIFVTFVVMFLFSRVLGLNKKMGMLLAFGTAICGSAAIAAVKPIIDAEKQDTAVAISVVNLLGVMAIFAFPIIGHSLHLTDITYGLWAGTSIQAVAQVVGAGFGFSAAAGLYATLIKLVRVLMLAPCVLILTLTQGAKSQSMGKSWSRYCPRFILLFYVLIIVNSTGYLAPVQPILAFLSNFFMTMALGAIGLESSMRHLFESGRRPMVVAMLGMAVLTSLSLYFSMMLA